MNTKHENESVEEMMKNVMKNENLRRKMLKDFGFKSIKFSHQREKDILGTEILGGM